MKTFVEFLKEESETSFTHAPTQSKVVLKKHVSGHTLLTGLKTPEEHRGKGGAENVMKQATDHLDSHKLTSVLYVIPDKDEDEDRLRKFYHKHGFEKSSEFKGGLIRKPKEIKS